MSKTGAPDVMADNFHKVVVIDVNAIDVRPIKGQRVQLSLPTGELLSTAVLPEGLTADSPSVRMTALNDLAATGNLVRGGELLRIALYEPRTAKVRIDAPPTALTFVASDPFPIEPEGRIATWTGTEFVVEPTNNYCPVTLKEAAPVSMDAVRAMLGAHNNA